MSIDATVALVSLDDAKTFLKIPLATTTEDTIVSSIVNGVSQFVQGYINRNLVSTARTEYYDGDGTKTLTLANYPVTTLTSVKIDSLRQFGSSTAVDIANCIQLAKETGILTLWNYYGVFSSGTGNVKVEYTAGLTLATMPYDLRLAVLKLVSKEYRNAYVSARTGITQENIGDKSTTIANEELPKDVKATLDNYWTHPAHGRMFA